MSLRKQIQDLENDKNRHDKQQHRIKSMQRKLLAEIGNREMRLIELDRLMSVPVADEFHVKVGKAEFKQGQEKARENAGALILQKMNSGLIREIGSFGEFTLSAGRDDFGFKVVLSHSGAEIALPFDSNANAGGVLMRLQNAIDKLPENKEKLRHTIDEHTAALPKLESQLQEWGKDGELAAARQRYKDVLEALKPKQSSNQANSNAAQDVQDTVVAENETTGNVQLDMAIAQLTPPADVQQHIEKTREMVRRAVGDANMRRVNVVSRVDALKHFVDAKHYDLDKSMSIAMGARGWHDNKTGQVFIVAEHDSFIQNPSWAAFTAWHELGHAKVNVAGRKEWQAVLADAYARNATVRALADKKMAETHGKYSSLNVATEEALVELFAAFKTGDYAVFKQRNDGIAFPIVPTRNFLQRVILALQAIVRRVLGKQAVLSDDALMGLLGQLDDVDLNTGEVSGSLNNMQFDLNVDSNSEFAAAVDDVSAAKLPKLRFIPMGTTPNVLKMLGLPDVKVSIHRDVLRKVMKDKHSVTAESLKRLPEQLNNPVAVMKSNATSSNPNGFVVLTELVEHENGVDKPVIAALNITQTDKGLEVMNVSSVYGRRLSQLKRDLENTLYWNVEKGSQFIQASGLQSPLKVAMNGANLLRANIKTEADLSQYQNSGSLNDDIRFDMAAADTPQQRNRAMSKLIDAVSFSGSLKDLKQRAGDAGLDKLNIGLQFLGRRQIIDVYGKLLPQLHAYDELVDKFGADGNKTAMRADELVIKWGKLKDADKLADLMHEATIAQVDADPLKKPDVIAERVAAENWLTEMDKRLEAAEQEASEAVDEAELKRLRQEWEAKQEYLEELEELLAVNEDMSGNSAMSEKVTDKTLKQAFVEAERMRLEVSRAQNAYTALRDKAERSEAVINSLKKKQADAESRYNKAVAAEQQLDDFNQRFNSLSDDAKAVYRQARDDYKQQFEQIQTEMKARLKRMGIERKDVFDDLDEKFAQGLKGVYFPLSRFGQYVVVVRDADGKPISVSRAESMNEARKLQSALQAQFPDDTVEKPVLAKEFNQSRDGVGAGFLKALRDEVKNNAGLNAGQLEFMEDALAQLHFKSLPDLSWAKHGIHRKNRAGYSNDARRAYAQSMSSGASYLSKLRYGDLMQDELDKMQAHTDSLKNTDEQPTAQRVVDEMVKRHDNMMNPNPNALSTGLTSFGFLWYLGLSPASALVNYSQTVLVAYPVMAAKWGYKKAARELIRASRQTYTHAKKPIIKSNGLKRLPSITADGWNDISGSLNADELAAYNRAVDDGTIDISQAHDLAGIASGEDSGVLWRFRGVMRGASFFFHQAERFNRQVTFVAAYRLAKQSGADSETAFEQAKKATYDGHFDYSASNRPRFMQGNVARVVFLFKQYSQNMIYTLTRGLYQSLKGDKEARKMMAGLLTLHAAAAGVLGLPMVSTLLAAASWLGSDDDEPFDAEAELRNLLAEIFGDKGSEIISKGVSRATPWDISGRVGLNNLIFPDVQEGLEGKRWAESFAAGLAGPIVGLGINWANGSQKLTQGDYGQALEAFMPVVIRGPLKALRLGTDGMQDSSGIMIKDDFNAAELIGQAAGFSASDARLAQESKSAMYQADRRLQARRSELLAMFAKAQMDGDGDKVRQARDAIMKWNTKNPSRKITVQQMVQSVRNRQRRINEAKDGIYLSKNRQDARAAGAFGTDD